jgi:hypothetical protein
LKELDKLNDIVNYPAIDLGDETAKIAFQITTQKDSEKVKDTIAKFNNHKLYEKYDRLILFVIGKKQDSYTTTFDTQDKFSFNKNADIWDDNFLIKEINKLSTSKLEKIFQFLKDELEPIYLPENLLDQDIAKCIDILKRDFGSTDSLSSQLNIHRETDDFIKNIKNPANNLSWEFFKKKIRGHLSYNKDIFEFLQSPINQKIQEDYLQVSQAIQNFYKDSKNRFPSFENVFGEIFKKLNTYDDEIAGVDIKLKILLHNMYFNCDIGHNPNNHD